jgi:hypothetical protein
VRARPYTLAKKALHEGMWIVPLKPPVSANTAMLA